MKRGLLIIFLLCMPLALPLNNLYQYDALDLQLDINGGMELVPTGGGARVKSASAELLLYPQESFRQKVVSVKNKGKIVGDGILFEWTDNKIEDKDFGYSALVKTTSARQEVGRHIRFPLSESDTVRFEEYLKPTETIDFKDRAIVAKAAELAEGEDDLFKVVFNLAEWVEKNVEYDLNTVTSQASQPASWVLDNRQGVCDEMTSLLIAMSRSLGIPARFVKGISYTTSDLFSEPWQPHGWAEIYFPGVGWVSFDITFGQFGYVDVTHIKFKEGADPQEPDSKYEWLANNVDVVTKQLVFNVDVAKKGRTIPSHFDMQQEVFAPQVEIGSFNLIKATIRNKYDYYNSVTLKLAVPKEISIKGRNQRTILLEPGALRETYWVLKVSDKLRQEYSHEFPFVIYSEKNDSLEGSFRARTGSKSYSEDNIDKLTILDEEKKYSQSVSILCDGAQQIDLNTKQETTCVLKNNGNTNLYQVKYCADQQCKTVDLLINQEVSMKVDLTAEEVGWKSIIMSANNDKIEKKISLDYKIVDDPRMYVRVEHPETVQFGETFTVFIKLKKSSFSIPQKVHITLKGSGFQNEWRVTELDNAQELRLDLENVPLEGKNKLTVTTQWEDNSGKKFEDQQETTIIAKPNNFLDRIKMMGNWFKNLFL